MPVSENESYTSSVATYRSDGLKINGLLTQPKGEMPKGGWPAIVFLHGYIPPKQYETVGQPYSAYVDYLARNGFVVFKPDYRGNGNSEGQPGGAYYSSDYVIDALNAYAALQNAKFVNPKKIGIWGHSMSGNVSLRAMAAKPDIPAVVIWSGAGYSYVDLTKYKISDASYVPSQTTASQSGKRGQLRKLYGNPDPSKLFWQQIAPTNYLKDLKGAIQLDQAVDDEAVNIGYSRDLANLLKKAKVKYEFDEYPSGGHNISGENFTVAMENTVAFFKKYLQ
jgi:dipeptidyl aminopeptidase/acylaminoacyl peptidase